MKTAKISLNSIDKVKAFVNENQANFDCDFDLVSGRYVIDDKIHHGYLQPGSFQADRPQTSMQMALLWIT